MTTKTNAFSRYAQLLVCGWVLLSAASAQSPAQTVRSRVGISIAWPDQQETIAEDVAIVKSLGVGYVRTDLHWDSVETQKGQFNWRSFDARADAIRGANLKLLAILDYNHPLYASAWKAGFYNEANISAFRRFAVAAVQRYHGPLVSFELYNEPNQTEYWELPPAGQEPKPKQYMNLVKATLPAIRAAVPEAVVLAPGLGHNPSGLNAAPWENEALEFAYLKDALDLGLRNHTRTISFHPYPDSSQPPENTLQTTYAKLRDLIASYPSSHPVSICNSESGYNTMPAENGVLEEQQSMWLPRHILLDIALGTVSTTIFTLRDSPSESMYFGLLREDGKQKPAFASIQTLLREIGDLEYTRRLPGPSGDWLLEFQGGGKTVVAGWTTGARHRVTVSGKQMTLLGHVSYLHVAGPLSGGQ